MVCHSYTGHAPSALLQAILINTVDHKTAVATKTPKAMKTGKGFAGKGFSGRRIRECNGGVSKDQNVFMYKTIKG